MRAWELVIVFAAAVGGGGVNAIAGGGTLLTFPTLLWLGRNPVLANATNALGLLPGTVFGAFGFRSELARSRVGATLLLALQEPLSARLRRHEAVRLPPGWKALAVLFQAAVGVYGGYFGAGIGILMLAALGLLGMTDLHQMNGVKNLLAAAINGIAIVWFVVSGAILWGDALVMMAGAALGGWTTSRLAYRVGRRAVRRVVVAIGLAMAAALALRLR